jgi:Cu/Ag efflux protein CusF
MKKLFALAIISAVAAAGLAAAANTPYSAIGIVQQADTAGRTVTLAHQPVPSLNWPAMTMQFSVLEPALLERLPTGQEVAFEFVQQQSGWRIVNAIPLAQPGASAGAGAPQGGTPGGPHGGMRGGDMSAMHQMCMDMMSQRGGPNR